MLIVQVSECNGVFFYLFLGNCTLPIDAAAPLCICNHGIEGAACDRCKDHFDPNYQCEQCSVNYIGYNSDCSMLCIHGQSKSPGFYDILPFFNYATNNF